ncbi:MAG TPA: hypothetical protein VH542_00745 [Steroidobacteraceae bacterium]
MPSAKSTARSLCGLAVLTLTCAVFSPAHAAADAQQVAQLQSQLEASLKAIDQLTARVRELEARMDQVQPGGATGTAAAAAPGAAPATPTPGAAPGATPDTAQDQRLASLENEVAAITAANAARHDDMGLPLHGFADVGAGTRNPVNPNLHGAAVGSVDFYLTPQLGERTRSLFELNFKIGTNGELVTALERAQLGYQFADATTLWLGRFHTPYGYYNTAFHHGQQISTALRRPGVVQFETTGGVMPAHAVGLWLQGVDRMDVGRLTYDVYVANAPRIVGGVIDSNNAGNAHGDALYGGNVGFLPSSLDGFRVGLSAFSTKVQDDLVARNLTRVNNYGVYAVYDTDRWENMAEYYWFDNKDLSGTTGNHDSNMGFIQLAYRAGLWTPYARYERADLDQTDHYFSAQRFGNSYYRTALGLRYDLDWSSALKLEIAQTHVTDRDIDTYEEALMQYAIRF